MNLFTIAFYNTENFFGFCDDGQKRDTEYVSLGIRKWTKRRYEEKIHKIGQAIYLIGQEETKQPPHIVGLAEIENKKVLSDLVNSEFLKEYNYRYVQFSSLDERGMSTALLFRGEQIEMLDSEFIRCSLDNEFTRDVLYVQLAYQQKTLHTLVVHLPSKRNLDDKRELRKLVLQKIRAKVNDILVKEPQAQIVVMGDFNENPDHEDAMQILKTQSTFQLNSDELYNPMLNLKKRTGSLIHKGNWILYDQILFSKSFLEFESFGFQLESVAVFKDEILKISKGRNAGIPFRTFAGKKYLGGYSDHFPVYAILNY